MLFRFVAFRYLKITLMIFVSFELFFVALDSLQYLGRFNDSINSMIMFFLYDAMDATNHVLPISILLGVIVLYVGLTQSNQYLAFISLGYSRRYILSPILVILILVLSLYVGMNFTPFVYAKESANNVISYGIASSPVENLFVKHNSDYIFFKRINPLLQSADTVKVFGTRDNQLESISEASRANFVKDEWVLENVDVMLMPSTYILGGDGVKMEHHDAIKVLRGFKPRILDAIYQNKPSVSALDAIRSIWILGDNGATLSRVRGVLYSLILIPFFVPFFTVVVVYYFPVLPRYSNLTVYGILLGIASLSVWGVFFALGKLTAKNMFIPELSLLVPFLLLATISMLFFNKFNKL